LCLIGTDCISQIKEKEKKKKILTYLDNIAIRYWYLSNNNNDKLIKH